MRISKLRALAVAALPVVAGVALTLTPGASEAAPHAGGAFPAHYAAPYLQVSDSDIGDLAADQSATGTKFYTLAFLTPSSGCNQLWEANGTGVGSFKSQISALQAAGGNVIPSFGGAQGGEIAQTCTDQNSLTAAYANVVNTYGTPRLDFDIEEDTIKDTAANQRRNSALAALQQQNPSVQVDYTLAVAPDGLPSTQLDILRDAKNKGLKVSVVNLMVMDFYDGQPVISDALAAARSTAGQLASLYGISTSAAYGMMGLTPIAGNNDDGAPFSQSDAQQLETFAAQNGVQELSFWEVQDYDKATGYAYSRIFNAISGGTTPRRPAASRSPVTAASASTSRARTAPTAPRWTCTPATAPTRSSGPRPAARSRRSASAWTSPRPASRTGPRCRSTTATAAPRSSGRTTAPTSW